jgi:hypothetical protein
MSTGERIEIRRDELFDAAVDEELAKLRARRGGLPPEPPPLSPLRRVLYSNLFYLPFAAFLGALAAWMLLEPHINEVAMVGGEVVLVNEDPFIYGDRSLTVANTEIVLGDVTQLEKGVDGQPAFASIHDIKPGDFVEVAGENMQTTVIAVSLRPSTPARAREVGVTLNESEFWQSDFVIFPLTGILITLFLLLAEGIASRNWGRMVERAFLGTLLAGVFCFLAVIPAVIVFALGHSALEVDASGRITIEGVSGKSFVILAVCRSIAWACVGAGLGVGMNLARSTRVQLRNSVLGGALGGALGGLFFDPIDRFIARSPSYFDAEADLSRLVGFIAVGVCIGLFVALVERLARVAWIKVRTGPLAGKAFVLYRSPTLVGSASSSDIYLFKDAEIDPEHARIHRVGNKFEIEDAGSRVGTVIGDRPVRRRRLASGDQIIIGSTVLEFEERAKNPKNG